MFDSSATTDDDNVFNFIEMDSPTAHRRPAAELETEVIELDLTEGKSTSKCLSCHLEDLAVDEKSICESCRNLMAENPALRDAAASVIATLEDDIVPEFGSDPPADSVEALAAELTQASNLATANAAVVGVGSLRTGEMQSVGWRNQDGYIQAIRNGVPAHTHGEYIAVLKNRFRLSGSALARLNLPGPMKIAALPEGAGIKHVPTGPSVFDLPKAERAFVVGPKVEKLEVIRRDISGAELIAGAVAEGHHAIVAWEGTSGMQRGDLVAALKSINRESWTPSAPNARAQAGSAIAPLGRGGLRVKSAVKSRMINSLAVNEHVWTIVRDDHVASVGSKSGDVVARFKLSGSTLTYEGETAMCEPVLATFAARMAAEQYKSSDVTGWLSRTIRWKLDGVRFGALGWLVPAINVAAATELCSAIQTAGFGSGWVTGLPVATSDQLRDGIVRGLIDEVTAAMDKLNTERTEVKNTKTAAIDAAMVMRGEPARSEALDAARKLADDIGEKRAHTYLKEFRAIGERVVAYGQVLGEQRVDKAREWVKRGVAELETIVGEDFSGIRQRFGLIWEEIERDRKQAGGVL